MGITIHKFQSSFLLSILICSGVLGGSSAYGSLQSAINKYRARRYAEAAGSFFEAKELARSLTEKRTAELYLAESLLRLDFPYSASKYYTMIVRRGMKSTNPHFRKALEALGQINSGVNLGQSQIVEMFAKRVDSSAVPGPARGFYFYYLGAEKYSQGKYRTAANHFNKVPSGSSYYPGAQFHLGVIANLRGRHSRAIDKFRKVRNIISKNSSKIFLWEQATLNLARVYYEVRRFDEAISFYAQIERNSDLWLDALWEGAWAHFRSERHNSTLGVIHTLHSPFFENRFYPESYILQSITFLRLCRYGEGKKSIVRFLKKYRKVISSARSLVSKYRGRSKAGDFFQIIYQYRRGELKRFKEARSILDRVSRSDAYKEASDTIRLATAEQRELNFRGRGFRSSGLLSDLKSFLKLKKKAAAADAGARLYRLAKEQYEYLRDLESQSGLVESELSLEKINSLRRKINIDAAPSKKQFVGGLTRLDLDQTLEYWPFIPNEYWEDELGWYIYNINSRCGARRGSK
jgi:tetratricopeptide (TPR) repeat protein